MPPNVPYRFISETSVGNRYALYTLVPLAHKSLPSLVDYIGSNAAADDWWSTVVLAPTHDFSDAGKNSLRDIHDYHISLLQTVKTNPHKLRPHTFIVVAHEDWKANGVLIVNLDCNPYRPGEISVIRNDAGMTGSTLLLLENNPSVWYDLKTGDTDTTWPDPIPGYTNTKWHKPGAAWFKAYAKDQSIRIKYEDAGWK